MLYRILAVVLVCFLLLANIASAQVQTRASEPRKSAVLAKKAEPGLALALKDSAVQAAIGRHVRNLDTRRAAVNAKASAFQPVRLVQSNVGPVGNLRVLSATELGALANLKPQSRLNNLTMKRPRAPSRITAKIGATPIPKGPQSLTNPPAPHLDVKGFADDLHLALKNSVKGYQMRMRRNGQTIYTLQWNWAQSPSDSALAWSQNRRMHVASISKLVTAMGLTHLLDAKGISYNAKIINYLPAYWAKGQNISKITFADLMNHRSGIVTGNDSDASFSRMKSIIAAGVSNPGSSSGYSNVNFALCRVLMATLSGIVSKHANFPMSNDAIWDWLTVAAYTDYIENNVFIPSGVTGATLANVANGARAYRWNDTGSGWDSKNLMGQAGGAAWHLTPDELLNVVGQFRRGNSIVSPSRAREVFNASYGLNSSINGSTSLAGRYYFKPGKWGRNGQVEQALVMILPEQIELVIFISSTIGPNDTSLQSLGSTLYKNNIIEP